MTMKSKFALVCRLILTFVRHPIQSVRSLSWRKLKKLLRYAKSGNLDDVKRLIYGGVEPQSTPSKLNFLVPEFVTLEKTLNPVDLPVCKIPATSAPQVSIVIPICSSLEATFYCIRSVVKNSGDISFEILIADDGRANIAGEICRLFPGVRRISVENGAGYFHSGSLLAAYAQGNYLLFLHECAQVQKNWLDPMVTLLEKDHCVGIVGPKLVYPDGTLVSAGGIVLRNGDTLRYGCKMNAASPEYQYLKECDYVLGAALMLPRSLWEQLGSFDAGPADVELAFVAREKGYHVVYQPESVIAWLGTEHCESETLSPRWKDHLINHPAQGESFFQARDCSYRKKTLLMVDQHVPHFDKDAGSRTVYQYLQLFVDAGFHVKFIGDDFCQHEPYTGVLQQMGIEVLYGMECARNWKKWIKDNGAHIDYVFLNRPHIASKYMPFLRKYTNARILYYGHDLVFLREMREYEITGDASFKDSAMEWMPKELELMRKSDMAYYPSYVEVNEVHSIDPDIRVKAIPAYLFEGVKWEGYDYDSRKDIMFIGGFGHRPNVDAVKWLAHDVLPELVKRLPDIKIHILGSNAPKEVLALANENLIMEGFVTDELLEQFYRSCRISLVPLRYGAGIKGKVVEAMRYGTPVVTTTTGAEGISNAEEVMLVEDDAAVLAQKLADLYQDPDRLSAMSQGSISYIQENFSPKNAISVIRSEFDLS